MNKKITLRHRIEDRLYTRQTARDYSHVLTTTGFADEASGPRFVLSWHGSEDNAQAACKQAMRAGWQDCGIEVINDGQ